VIVPRTRPAPACARVGHERNTNGTVSYALVGVRAEVVALGREQVRR